jgi:hypothetical protein
MNTQNDAIIQELIKMDQQQQKTGKRNHKRHNEILMEMCKASNDMAQRSADNTESVMRSFDKLLERYNQMKLRADSLEQANYELFWIMQAGHHEVREYRA